MKRFTKVKRVFTIKEFSRTFDRMVGSDFVFSGEMHDFCEIVFVENGKMEASRDEDVFMLEDGDLIIYAPMEFHGIRAAEKTTPVFKNLSFRHVGRLPDGITKGIYKLDPNERIAFLELFRRAKKFLYGKDNDEFLGQEAVALLEAFIIHLYNNHNITYKPLDAAGANTFKQIVKTMHNHIYENLSLPKIAEMNFISVSYLKVLFNRYANTSPKSYYTNLKIYEAIRLLESGLSVTLIAEKMNFSSPNYFCVFFKKHTGKTPLEYLKRNLEN